MPIELKVPSVGESVTEVEIGDWLKAEGDSIEKDENVVVIESEKATVELPAPVSGKLVKIRKRTGESAHVGEVVGEIEQEEVASPPSRKKPAGPKHAEGRLPGETDKPPAAAESEAQESKAAPAEPSGDGRESRENSQQEPLAMPAAATSAAPPVRSEEVIRMNLWRRTLAKRLVQAKQEAALLTTFNEIDMSTIAELRQKYSKPFQEKYQTKLGLMSFFAKASVDALKEFPQVNAEVRGESVVYRNYCDIGIAVSTDKGLVVPILRHTERLSFAELEKSIADLAQRARENKLQPEDLEGGTFTITNGGVFGSLVSTPIVNPPQSAILGLHAIQERPVAREGQVVIRPMMYVALTYDHRIIDGREAVLFLRRVKETIEDPARMLIEA